MELVRFTSRPPPLLISSVSKLRVQTANNPPLLYQFKKNSVVQLALPENAASIVVTSIAVGAAATLLAKRLKNSEKSAAESLKTCEDCNGSGLCSECKGEGYVFKQISEESAQKKRMSAKNAATRYTAGLPTKWIYCSKCNSNRSCRICQGSGQVKL